VKIATAGGRLRRVGFYSAVRREVPIRTFNDWGNPPPGFCEIDMVAHGGTSVAGSFIQTLTMVDIATGWTECLPLVARDGSLVVEAMSRAQSLFPWLIRGADFDNDSAFMNDVVVPWCREQKIEVTRSRAYKKNDQAFVEQKNGAVVRRLVGEATIESWLATEPQITALAIVRRLAAIDPATFSYKQHSIMQRLIRSVRRKATESVIVAMAAQASIAAAMRPGPVDGASCDGHSAPPHRPSSGANLDTWSGSAFSLRPTNHARVTLLREAIREIKAARRAADLRLPACRPHR
jgi:hypothetical protein